MRTWSNDHPKARLLERKQEAIKVAAKELFLQHGYAATTMEIVARQADVSIMTLYRHFRGKDVLFQAVILHLCAHKVKHERETFWQGSISEVLHKLGEVRFDFLLNTEEAALYRVIMGAMEPFPEVGRVYYQLHFEKVFDPLATYLQELDHNGTLRVPDPHFSAQAFLSLLQGQLVERVRLGAGTAPTSEETEQHIAACVTLFLAAHQGNHSNGA